MSYFGMDLGGTKIEGIVLKEASIDSEVCRLRISTEAAKGYEHIVSQVALLLAQLEEASGCKATKLGIGTPGCVDPPTQVFKNSNATCLNTRPFHKDLSAALGVDVEVVIANDANCFALAEHNWGAVRQVIPTATTSFGVIMGTGVGGGLIINNTTVSGAMGIAGEWGHNVLIPDGPDCYCGKKGCVEQVLSGPAVEKFYAEQTDLLLPLQQIYQRYLDASDEAATAAIERLLNYFGMAIATIINIVDPDVVVIGGGVSNIAELYTIGYEHAKNHVFNPILTTPIVAPLLGDSAGVYGAAALVM